MPRGACQNNLHITSEGVRQVDYDIDILDLNSVGYSCVRINRSFTVVWDVEIGLNRPS